MRFRRWIALAMVAGLLVALVGSQALAKQGSDDRLSAKFEDMSDYSWGLGDVVRLMAKGVFKGRSDSQFAPGAAITRQEMAVAAVRLMGVEAPAVTTAAVSDWAQVADWARPAVALLVSKGAFSATEPFRPTAEATRLDVAVLLVKLLELQPVANASLTFKDADKIPAALAGYVAAAVEAGLIKGYEDGQFKPDRSVRRVEIAVMMARADRSERKPRSERERRFEVKGTVLSVATDSITLKVGAAERTITLAPNADIFVEHVAAGLAQVAVGMRVEAKLNADGLAIFVEAEVDDSRDGSRDDSSSESTGGSNSTEVELKGRLTNTVAAGAATIVIDGVSYPLSQNAEIRLKGSQTLTAGTFVEVKIVGGTVVRVKIESEDD